MKEQYVSAFSPSKEGGALNFNQRASKIREAIGSSEIKYAQKEDGRFKGVSFDLATELPAIVDKVSRLKKGDLQSAAADITVGEYVKRKYGIATDKRGYMDNFLKLFGINKNEVTLAQLSGKTNMSFTTVPELNKNFEWLIGETITEALRAGLMTRGIYRRLVSSMETVPYDSIKVPVIKNANGFFEERREGETVKIGTLDFDQITAECRDIATGFKLTDRVTRNVRINMLQDWLISTTGKNLDGQLTYEAVQRLLNGNPNSGGADAAPVVGVDAPGSIDYDNDILEVVIGGGELGYSLNTVLGDRGMIKEIMSLPEFKGFDGGTVKAESMMPDIPMPSEYVFIPTGAMPKKQPAGGQLLFLDPRYAMKHYSTKPLTMEGDRIPRQLTSEFVISMTSLFLKMYADAAYVLDSTLDVTAEPFPVLFDAETYEQRGF